MSEYLPPEILFQIFLNLPSKTLRRIVSVSKLWYSIISSSSFVSAHLSQPPHPQNSSFFLLKLLDEEDEESAGSSLSFLHQTQNQENVHSLRIPSQIPYTYWFVRKCDFVETANGLILLKEAISNDGSEPDTFLWNPAVGVFVKLPEPEIKASRTDRCALGFWFDSRNCDFKFMRIVYRRNSKAAVGYDFPPSAEVYSLNTGEWRRVNVDGAKCYLPKNACHQVYLNGRSHWIGYGDDPFENLIMSFDMNDGVFRKISLPLCFEMSVYHMEFSETMGCLAVIGNDHRIMVCCIWVMKKYGDLSSWTNLCNIPLQTSLNWYMFLGFWKNGDVLLIRDSCQNDEVDSSQVDSSQLVRYVPGSVSLVDDLHILLGGLSRYCFCDGIYEESLALLDLEFSNERMKAENRPPVYPSS